MSKLRYQFGLIASMLMFGGCSSDEATVTEGVAADGTTANEELSAGLEGNTAPEGSDSNAGDGLDGTQDAAATPADKATVQEHADDQYKVVAHFLNVRKGPGNSYPVVRVLKKGDTVHAHDKSGIWLKISEQEFVSSRYVSAP